MASITSVPILLDSDPADVLGVTAPLARTGNHTDDVPALEDLTELLPWNPHFQHIPCPVTPLTQIERVLRRQVILAQEAERQRIARDLHDEAGHALTAAVLRLDLEMIQFAGDPMAVEALRRVRHQLVECCAVLHTIAFNLRPRVLEDLGLHAALRSLATRAMEGTDLDATVAISGSAWTLDEMAELAILRVVQEALTNVLKHAHASRVRVGLRYAATGLTLQIVDDGIGLRPRAVAQRTQGERVSLGISGMRERIELLGGRFSIRCPRSGGTRITARLPR